MYIVVVVATAVFFCDKMNDQQLTVHFDAMNDVLSNRNQYDFFSESWNFGQLISSVQCKLNQKKFLLLLILMSFGIIPICRILFFLSKSEEQKNCMQTIQMDGERERDDGDKQIKIYLFILWAGDTMKQKKPDLFLLFHMNRIVNNKNRHWYTHCYRSR